MMFLAWLSHLQLQESMVDGMMLVSDLIVAMHAVMDSVMF